MIRKLPIGIQSFREIRENNLYYVDKSYFISQILRTAGQTLMYTRPRRFGKSVNLSMLDCFFNLEYEGNGWFDGLKISEDEKAERHKNAHPVIYFDFKDVYDDDFGMFLKKLSDRISELSRRYPYLENSEKLMDISREDFKKAVNGNLNECEINSFIHRLSYLLQLHHGKRVVILLDNCDSPIHSATDRNHKIKISGFMERMFSLALKGNDNLDFAVITGLLPIITRSVFSGLNNIEIHTVFDFHSDDAFGFTDEETKQILADCGRPDKYEEAKEWYGGYCFGDTTAYNPWSVLNYVGSGFKPDTYWADTDGNGIVRLLVDKDDFCTDRNLRNLSEGSKIEFDADRYISALDPDVISSHIEPAMAMTGYFGAVAQSDFEEFHIPNKELRITFEKMFLESVSGNAYGLISDIGNAMTGNDAEKLKELIPEYAKETIDAYLTHKEKDLRNFVCGTRSILNGICKVEEIPKSKNGYFGILFTCSDAAIPRICLGFKSVRSKSGLDEATAGAIAYIKKETESRGSDGDAILYGIAFCSKTYGIGTERIFLG